MFFLSMEDDLLRLFIPDGVKNFVARLGLGDEAIHAGPLSRSIENAQKQLEGQNFQRRKNVLSYDDVMNEQRKIIYKQRGEVLDGMDLREMMKNMISSVITEAVNAATSSDDHTEWELDALRTKFYGVLFNDSSLKYTDEELKAILRDDHTPVFAAVDDDERLLGYAFCVFQQHVDHNILTDIKTLYIDDLCVDETCRSQHVGTALYEHVLAFAKDSGCYNVTLNVWACNEGALRFYEKCGLTAQKIGMEKIL